MRTWRGRRKKFGRRWMTARQTRGSRSLPDQETHLDVHKDFDVRNRAACSVASPEL